jgi:hypothetical protein
MYSSRVLKETVKAVKSRRGAALGNVFCYVKACELCEKPVRNYLISRITYVTLSVTMQNRKYFRVGSRVSANSFSGQKIIGIYAGSDSKIGCFVRGIIAHPSSPDDAISQIHKCSRLSLESLEPRKNLPNVSEITFQPGEPCQARTITGQIVRGIFQQVSGPRYAWIKTSDGRAIKIIRETLLTLA